MASKFKNDTTYWTYDFYNKAINYVNEKIPVVVPSYCRYKNNLFLDNVRENMTDVKWPVYVIVRESQKKDYEENYGDLSNVEFVSFEDEKINDIGKVRHEMVNYFSSKYDNIFVLDDDSKIVFKTLSKADDGTTRYNVDKDMNDLSKLFSMWQLSHEYIMNKYEGCFITALYNNNFVFDDVNGEDKSYGLGGKAVSCVCLCLKRLKEHNLNYVSIHDTGHEDIDLIVRAMQVGLYPVMFKYMTFDGPIENSSVVTKDLGFSDVRERFLYQDKKMYEMYKTNKYISLNKNGLFIINWRNYFSDRGIGEKICSIKKEVYEKLRSDKMNVLLVIGRGIEACGVTRFTIELEEWLKSVGHNVKVLAGNDKKWGREKAQPNDFEKHIFKSGVWNDGVKYDMCIITSVPPKKIDKNEEAADLIYNNFIDTLKGLNTRLVYLQCDNKIHSINRNFYADEKYMMPFFSILDRIIVHNFNADFVKKFIDKYFLRECKFTLGQQVLISTDFDEVASQIVPAEKVDKTCWFIGRSAQWKGWREFRDFHTTTLRPNGYTSVIEGIELSINAKQDMSNIDENNKYTWRDDNIYYGINSEITPDVVMNNIDEFRDKPSLIFGPYVRLEALNRIHRSKFGMFFTFTGPEFGGQIEITFLEIVGAGTVPVIRKELYDNAFFNDVYLKDLGTPEELGIVVYDYNKKEECLELLNKLNDDETLYNEYLNRALKFCKSQFDRKYIINRLFEKCISDDDGTPKKEIEQISLWW